MRTTLLAAAIAAMFVTTAHADDIMMSRYGNTTMVTDAKGVQTRLYYQAGGSPTGKQGSMNFEGTWKVDASNRLCLTFKQPVQGFTNPTCVAVTAHKIGDSWQSANGDRVMLVKGVQ
jgi:hypothetical protein